MFCPDDGSSYVKVSVEAALKAAYRTKFRVWKARMRALRREAVEMCSGRKYVFFGPRNVPTEKEIREAMRKLVHEATAVEGLSGDFKFI